jgi:hypothetical protein
VTAGKGATLLIHEATFDDDMLVHAEAKRHSTTSEALGVSKQMGAEYTVLTHFSQRLGYCTPSFDCEAHPNAIVAYDHMRLRFSDLPLAAKLAPAMRVLFDGTDDGSAASAAIPRSRPKEKGGNPNPTISSNGGASASTKDQQRGPDGLTKGERKAKAVAKWKAKENHQKQKGQRVQKEPGE